MLKNSAFWGFWAFFWHVVEGLGGGGGLISLFIASMTVYSEFQFLRGIVHFLSLSCTVFPRRAYNRTEDDSVSPKTKH